VHRKVPAWFGGGPRGKGPEHQAPRRAAYPVEGRVEPAPRGRPGRRTMGPPPSPRRPGRQRPQGCPRDPPPGHQGRPEPHPTQGRRPSRRLPDQQGALPELPARPGPRLADRHRRHRRRLPPHRGRPIRRHRSPLGTPRRRSNPQATSTPQQRRLRDLLALPPEARTTTRARIPLPRRRPTQGSMTSLQRSHTQFLFPKSMHAYIHRQHCDDHHQSAYPDAQGDLQ